MRFLLPISAWILVTCLATLYSSESTAQKGWPSEAIRIVVPFTPGGAPDTLARVLAEDWQRQLKVPIMVENRPGYGGNIAAEFVAKAKPDGYTLLIGTVGIHAINGALYPKLNFDPIRDFTPICFLASTPNVLVVSKKSGFQSLSELIAYAKAHPNQLSFGSSGSGTSLHMSGELLQEMAGIKMRHIPYKGRAQSIPDLISGRIPVLFDNLASSLPLIQAQEIRALGITTLKRSPVAPEIPTLAEEGLPGFEAVSWFSLMAPAHLPKEIEQQLNQLALQTLSNPEIKTKLFNGALITNPGSSEALEIWIARESIKWRKLVEKSGAKLD